MVSLRITCASALGERQEKMVKYLQLSSLQSVAGPQRTEASFQLQVRYLGYSAIRTFHKTGRMATMKRYVAQYNSWQCEQRAFKLRDVLTCPHCICRMCV